MKNDSKNTNEAQDKNIEEKKEKKGKLPIGAKIVNIVTAVIILLALVFALQSFYAKKHLHNNYFGYAMLPVSSDSMKLDKEKAKKDNFERGDLIFVKLLKDEQKKELKVGDIVTFEFPDMDGEDGAKMLNTHRIIEIRANGYRTRGDADEAGRSFEDIKFEEVVGVYRSKINNVGHFFLFLETRAGMFVIIVLPFIFLLLLSIFYFVRNFKQYSKEKVEEVTESTLQQEKERLRQEILKEMQQNNQTAIDDDDGDNAKK